MPIATRSGQLPAHALTSQDVISTPLEAPPALDAAHTPAPDPVPAPNVAPNPAPKTVPVPNPVPDPAPKAGPVPTAAVVHEGSVEEVGSVSTPTDAENARGRKASGRGCKGAGKSKKCWRRYYGAHNGGAAQIGRPYTQNSSKSTHRCGTVKKRAG
ncbi:hypothetical protein C8R45DRAFT_1088503 [Mycena sanguinolenta]|nr:hypothetical protein C8R45DRAFT_1088503 [Mycena sanguinolenta]